MTLRFTITTRKGLQVNGAIQGSGGPVGAGSTQLDLDRRYEIALARLRVEIERANSDLEFLTLAEYEPRCVRVYRSYEEDPFIMTTVSLKGSTVERGDEPEMDDTPCDPCGCYTPCTNPDHEKPETDEAGLPLE